MTIGISYDEQESVNVVCDNGDRNASNRSTTDMSETADIQTKPKPARDNSKDKRTLDQVEKWMEMIREINREPVRN